VADKQGFASRVKRAWNEFWGTTDTTPSYGRREDFEPPNGSEVLPIAARGDVFDLHIVPYFRWSSSAMSFETLSRRSLQYVEPARGRLLREIWREARSWGPTQLREAENAINELKAVKDGWCYEDDEGQIRCSPTVRVLLDPRLRDQLLPFELRMRELERTFDYNQTRAQRIETLTEAWLQIMRKLEENKVLGATERQFLVPFAASMADRDFAVVMHALADKRSELGLDLVAVLHQASKNHEGVGLFEFAQAYDMAAQFYAKKLGLGPYRWNLADMNPAEAK